MKNLFRCRSHNLPVNNGRFIEVTQADLKCALCKNGDVGDEYHYLCVCSYFNTLSAKDGDLRLSASNACLPKTEISVFVTECVFFTSTCYKLHMFTLRDVLYS